MFFQNHDISRCGGMADANDSKSFGKPCGFESHHRHFIIKQLRIERFWAVFLFLLSFLYFGVFWEDIDDCIRRGHLAGEIQMCINVACCADVAVPQPLLNLLQAHAIGIEQTGTTMPLRYNYDKPEKPRRIKGFEVFSLVFSSFSKPKNHTEISRIIGGVSLTTNE